jgi:hypothetical protein
MGAKEKGWDRPVVLGASLAAGFYLPEMKVPFLTLKSDQLKLECLLDEVL